MYRRERINERDVPESQHTIFIRGLPGSLTTEEIRDFFGKDTGCTFDFVKVSPDRAKLYVAVRFESKTVARQIMDKCTAEGTILGHEVDLTWFRDIRRYLAHCAKQGVRPSRFNNRGRDYAYRGSGRRSRSYTRSPERGPTEGSGENKSFSRSVSRSPSARSLTRSDAHSRSRSKSASSKSSQQSETKSLDYSEAVSNFGILNNFNKKERIASPSPPPKKQKSKKKERKDKKKRKHYSPKSSSPVIHMTKTQHNDVSDMEASDGEPSLPSKYANANQTHSVPSQPQMTITMSKPIGPTKPDSQSFTHRHVTVGSLATNQQSQQKQASYYDVHATATQAKQSQQLSDSNNEADIKFRQTFTVDLDSNASIPKFKSEQPGIVYQPMNGTKAIKDDVISAKRPRVELESLQQPPSIPPTKRESNLLSNNFFKDIQDKILKGFKFKPPTNENKATPSLIMQRMAEEMREEKINKLSVELQECLNNKKRELEQSYRSDCETFGFVTQKLIEKSRALEDPLKVALLEIMKDFKNENMKQFDEFLDQISYA